MKGAIFCNGVYYGGEKGDPGVSISEIVGNKDGTISIFLTDGSEHIYRIPGLVPNPTEDDIGKILRVDEHGEWVISEEGTSLPEVSSEDAGKVLKVDENGDWAAAEETVSLPEVSSEDARKVLVVNDLGEWELVPISTVITWTETPEEPSDPENQTP